MTTPIFAPRDAICANLHDLFVALIAAALLPDGEGDPWRQKAGKARERLRDGLDAIDIKGVDELWAIAIRDVELDPVIRRDQVVNSALPMNCPFRATDLVSDRLDISAVMDQIRSSASSG